MVRDPAAQLGVSLLTGQLACLHLRPHGLALGAELTAERLLLGRRVGAQPPVKTRAEPRSSAGTEPRATARVEAGACTGTESRVWASPQPGGIANTGACGKARPIAGAEAIRHPHAAEAVGG